MQFDWKIILLTVFSMIVDFCACNTTVSSHTDYNCTDAEVKQSACLNGGVCFVVKITSREPACHCPLEYTGKRCQELNYELLLGSAQIAIIVCVVVLILLLTGLAIWIWYRRRKKLPIIPCKKQNHDSINKAEEEPVEMDKMLNSEEKNKNDTRVQSEQ